jgi:hypothetical protein
MEFLPLLRYPVKLLIWINLEKIVWIRIKSMAGLNIW